MDAPENLTILFEDDDFIVVDKPSGVLVHPTHKRKERTIVDVLREARNSPELTLPHRLDRETSGVLLLAKTKKAAGDAGRAFMAKNIQKQYLARVRGKPRVPFGDFELPLGRDPKSEIVIRRRVLEGGESSSTSFQVLHEGATESVIFLRPHSGRRHQLRVLCEHLGSPIVGDPLYGHPDAHYLQYTQGEGGHQRMWLHAWRMMGKIAGHEICFEAPIPSDLVKPLKTYEIARQVDRFDKS